MTKEHDQGEPTPAKENRPPMAADPTTDHDQGEPTPLSSDGYTVMTSEKFWKKYLGL